MLAGNLYNIHQQKDNFLLIDNSIDKITVLDKVFNLYLESPSIYQNFDEISDNIDPYKDKYLEIHSNPLLQNIEDKEFKASLKELVSALQYKFESLKQITSMSDKFHNALQIMPLTNIDKKSIHEIEKELTNLVDYEPQTSEANFRRNAQIILEHKIMITSIKNSLQRLNIEEKIGNFNQKYQHYLQSTTNKAYLSISILSLLLIISVISSLIHEYKLTLSNNTLLSFKRAVEHSNNIVIIADKDKIIKYVNQAFTKSTGYTAEEVIGKRPDIISSHLESDEFYKELTQTIDSGQIWHGEITNKDKTGMLLYEKASIIPVFENGKIIEFTAIKLDITNEKIAQQKLQEQEKLLAQQSKMASMGEMMENIAHQWRQPLNVISVAASGMLINREFGFTTPEKDIHALKSIGDSTQYLSQTINDFKDFFKENKVNKKFSIKKACKKTVLLTESKFKNSGIEIIEKMSDTKIFGSHSQFTQITMNLFSNAHDVLKMQNDTRKKLILIELYEKDEKAVLKIKDSGGGISENIIDRVFEPYFTTKHKAQGTGIGLYMSMEIVRKHMNGTMTVNNESYIYEGKQYTGACFTLILPLDKRKKSTKHQKLVALATSTVPTKYHLV